MFYQLDKLSGKRLDHSALKVARGGEGGEFEGPGFEDSLISGSFVEDGEGPDSLGVVVLENVERRFGTEGPLEWGLALVDSQ